VAALSEVGCSVLTYKENLALDIILLTRAVFIHFVVQHLQAYAPVQYVKRIISMNAE
jgi:hypothetical protein